VTAIIRIGYSGSRHGMTKPQLLGIYWYIARVKLENDSEDVTIEVHHGDCLGGDAQFHVIATVLGCRTVAHPPIDSRLRAGCQADEIRRPKPYLARDWDIVTDTGELLATPNTPVPYQNSGTWTTTGYAVQLRRPAKVFMPNDGAIRAGSEFFGALLPAVPGNVSN
jgi:hypothetical protein